MKEYTWSELKQSSLIYNRKSPAFGVVMVALSMFFVTLMLILAATVNKIYVVKANGIATSISKVNIMNKVSSSVDSISVQSGDTVAIGDILFVMDSTDTQAKINQVSASVTLLIGRIALVERLLDWIDLFLLDETGDDGNITLDNSKSRLNPFDNTKLEERSMFAQAKMLIAHVKTQLDNNLAGGDSGTKIFDQKALENIKPQFASQHYSTIDDLQGQLVQAQAQLQYLSDNLDAYIVKAELSGVVYLANGISVGTMLQAGSLLGNIQRKDSSDLIFETMLSSIDRSRVSVGSIVSTIVAGIVQQEYGTVSGVVEYIDSDVTRTEDGQVFFRIIVRPSQTYLIDKQGKKVNIVTGMLAESRITYSETTWLKWGWSKIFGD